MDFPVDDLYMVCFQNAPALLGDAPRAALRVCGGIWKSSARLEMRTALIFLHANDSFVCLKVAKDVREALWLHMVKLMNAKVESRSGAHQCEASESRSRVPAPPSRV